MASSSDERSVKQIVNTVPALGAQTVFQLADDAKGKGGKLTVEHVRPPEATLARTGCRGHTFHDVGSLIAYLNKFTTPDCAPVVYVDAENSNFHAVIDELAERGVEELICQPTFHPLWQPWRRMAHGGKHSLDNFLDFLRDHRSQVIDPNPRELVLALSQIRASTEVELHHGRGHAESVNGVLIKRKIEGNTASELVDLPEQITLLVRLYVADPEPVKVTLDLSLSTSRDGEELFATLSRGQAIEAEVAALQAMAVRVRAEAPPSVLVVNGAPSWECWDTI